MRLKVLMILLIGWNESDVCFLFALPVFVVRFVVEGGVFHEQNICIGCELPTMRTVRAMEKM